MENDRKILADTVHDFMEIELTEAQIDEILADPKVKAEFGQWGMDTGTREAVNEFLARKIVGRRWPLYGDPKAERDAFHAEYRENAGRLGYFFPV